MNDLDGAIPLLNEGGDGKSGLLEQEERRFLEELIGWLGIPTEELDSMLAALEQPRLE